jgi:hypothetical protein
LSKLPEEKREKILKHFKTLGISEEEFRKMELNAKSVVELARNCDPYFIHEIVDFGRRIGHFERIAREAARDEKIPWSDYVTFALDLDEWSRSVRDEATSALRLFCGCKLKYE